jgi:hypothetical protein
MENGCMAERKKIRVSDWLYGEFQRIAKLKRRSSGDAVSVQQVAHDAMRRGLPLVEADDDDRDAHDEDGERSAK